MVKFKKIVSLNRLQKSSTHSKTLIKNIGLSLRFSFTKDLFVLILMFKSRKKRHLGCVMYFEIDFNLSDFCKEARETRKQPIICHVDAIPLQWAADVPAKLQLHPPTHTQSARTDTHTHAHTQTRVLHNRAQSNQSN